MATLLGGYLAHVDAPNGSRLQSVVVSSFMGCLHVGPKGDPKSAVVNVSPQHDGVRAEVVGDSCFGWEDVKLMAAQEDKSLEHYAGHGLEWQVVKRRANSLLESSIIPFCLGHVVSCSSVVHDDIKIVIDHIHLVLELLIAVDRSDGKARAIVNTKDGIQGTV